MIVSPGKWVSEEQLIALKGIKKGTLKKAREKSFMEGREYKHVAHDGMPWDNSPCFYNLEEIDRWIGISKTKTSSYLTKSHTN